MSNAWLSRSRFSVASSLLALSLVAGGCTSADEVGDRAADKTEQAADSSPSEKAAGEKVADAGAAPRKPVGKYSTAPKDAPAGDARESLSPPGGVLAMPDEVADRFGKAGGVREAEQKAMAQHYYETGKRLFDEQDFSRAYDNLRMAVERDPTLQAATELYYVCGSIVGKREDELRSSIERITQEHKVKVQLTRQEMIRFFEAGEKAFAENDFDQAIRDLERAREMIAWYPYQIDDGKPPFRERSEKMIAEAKRKRNTEELERRDRQEREAVGRARYEEREKLLADTRRVDQMLRQAGDQIQARRYKEAKATARRVLDIEPTNPFAKKLVEYAQQGEHTLTDKGIAERYGEQRWQNELNQEQVSQPHEGQVIKFPEDFQERTKDRRSGIALEGIEEPYWIRNYRKILRERKVTLNFPDVPLQDVILFLQDITGLNFVIGPNVDAAERRISLRLKDIVLENALKIILEQTKLAYIFDRESIIIAEPGTAAGETYFEIYDVSDILYKITDFKASRISLPNPDAPSGGGGGGSLVFDDPAASGGNTISPDVLIEIIKGSTGGDESWGDGTTIEGHRGQLLVTNRRETHQKIADVLENLRRNQGIFVHVETRFIDITNDMLEDVGVDFRGLGGNSGDEISRVANSSFPFGTPLDAFSDIRGGADARDRWGGTDVGGARSGVTPPQTRLNAAGQPTSVPGPNPEPGVDNFVWRTQHIYGGNLGGQVLRGTRLVGGGGLLLQATQLDHWQMNAILHAENETSKVRRLTAPRVTAANREQVYTSVLTQRAYVSDWELLSGGTGLQVVEVADPVVATFQEGVVLEVRPTVSSDRKFVTLDVRPSLATLVNGNIRTILVNLGSLQQAALQVPIGLPEITLEEAFTSVTIPDGGTALLGGFRQISETHQESTLPIVDSIPLIDFFFSRRGEVIESRSLVVLVTAHIVSIRDEESKVFNKSGM